MSLPHSAIHKHSGNSVDPDQLASQKPADQDLHCFQNRLNIAGFSMVTVNMSVYSTLCLPGEKGHLFQGTKAKF